MPALDSFSLQDELWFESIAEYSALIAVDESNCVRWKYSEHLVEDYLLDELYSNGYISANARASTLKQTEREQMASSSIG
jgi:hypothetical protein